MMRSAGWMALGCVLALAAPAATASAQDIKDACKTKCNKNAGCKDELDSLAQCPGNCDESIKAINKFCKTGKWVENGSGGGAAAGAGAGSGAGASAGGGGSSGVGGGFVGTWAMDPKSKTAPDGNTAGALKSLTIKADGSFEASFGIGGTWKMDGDKMMVAYSSMPSKFRAAERDGALLKFPAPSGEAKFVYLSKK
jgi:hypothetical protein